MKLKQYKGLKAVKQMQKISDAQVMQELENIRRQRTRDIPVTDRPAQNGDEVIIDYADSKVVVERPLANTECGCYALHAAQALRGTPCDSAGNRAFSVYGNSRTYAPQTSRLILYCHICSSVACGLVASRTVYPLFCLAFADNIVARSIHISGFAYENFKYILYCDYALVGSVSSC